MGEVSTDDVDLFGEAPAPYRDPRGRRKLRFDAQTYEKVENLRALGMNQEEIATAINVSVPTLRKYFLPELQAAVSRVKARVFLAMMDKVDEGSVPAMRAALQLLEQGGMYGLEKPIGDMRFVADTRYLAAMNAPGGGKNDVPNRLKRQFGAFNVPLPSAAAINGIFGRLVEGRFPPGMFADEVVQARLKPRGDWPLVLLHRGRRPCPGCTA